MAKQKIGLKMFILNMFKLNMFKVYFPNHKQGEVQPQHSPRTEVKMPFREKDKAALAALWCAKTVFATLSILKEYFESDLDMAKVAFTLALRTRPDYLSEDIERFEYINRNDPFFLERNLSASIYEISKYAKIDRATVRRKLLKLENRGFVVKNNKEGWSLVNFLNDPNSAAAISLKLLFRLYLQQAEELSRHLMAKDIEIALKSTDDVPDVYRKALGFEEVLEKIGK